MEAVQQRPRHADRVSQGGYRIERLLRARVPQADWGIKEHPCQDDAVPGTIIVMGEEERDMPPQPSVVEIRLQSLPSHGRVRIENASLTASALMTLHSMIGLFGR